MDNYKKALVPSKLSSAVRKEAPTLPENDQPLQSPEALAEKDPRVLRAKLGDAEERLGFVLESIKDCALLLIDVNGTISGWSAGSEIILGYRQAEIIGQPLHRIFTPEDIAAKIPEQEMQFSRAEGRATDNRWHVRKDGSLFWAAGFMRPLFLFETNKELRGYVKLVRDLTEMKRTEERINKLNQSLEVRVAERTRELAESNKELRSEMERRKSAEAHLVETNKFEAIGRLAGGVAHDFNNLITGIMGIATSLSEESPDPHLRGELAEISKAAQKATVLTRQLLAIGRKRVVTLQTVNFNDLIAETIPFYKRLLREDIRFVTQLDSALGNIRANADEFQQVLNNLILNAQDSMPSGGTLTVQTTNIELEAGDKRGYFDVAPGPYIAVSVTDSGHGMDDETQAHIFEPFFTTKEAGKGSGLGLAAVYGIVSQSGGDIAVASEPNRGTAITLFLPRVATAVVSERQDATQPATRGGSETILIVDDDALVRRVSARALEKRGYHVLQAGGDKEAIAVVAGQSKPVDLIFTDIVMPGMSGRELATLLTEKTPGLAVLYTSGHSIDIVVNRGVENASIDFIEKPFSSEGLALRVREVLDKRRPLGTRSTDRRINGTPARGNDQI